jgi:hypothetical protein
LSFRADFFRSSFTRPPMNPARRSQPASRSLGHWADGGSPLFRVQSLSGYARCRQPITLRGASFDASLRVAFWQGYCND